MPRSLAPDLGGVLTLEDLGNLGEFVGGIAVVMTLVYLAIQVQRNTAALRTASRQDIVESLRAFYRPLITSGETTQIYLQGLRDYPNLPQPQRARFSALLTDQGLHFESAFALYQSGTLDLETYRSYRDFFCALITTPGGAAFWNEARPFYPTHMTEAVEVRISQGELPAILAEPSVRAE